MPRYMPRTQLYPEFKGRDYLEGYFSGSSISSGNSTVLIYSAVFRWQAGAFLNIVPHPQHSYQATVHS